MIAALLFAAVLGTSPVVHHAVSTKNPQAQHAFDEGLAMLYAYDGDAADIAFAQALSDDPHLAMAAWGEALANGTDLNTHLTPERFAKAHTAAAQALALEAYASPEERLYVQAVAARYAGTYDQREDDEAQYRERMAALVAAYPHDDDAASLYAEALLEETGVEKPDPQPLRIIAAILARDPDHLFANHLCMHAYDYAADRTPALACAARVAAWTFSPAQEHLAHMPAHTYIETGRYDKALTAAETAWRLREQWNAQPNPPFQLRYAAHDAYIGWTTAMMLGDLNASEAWAARVGQAYEGSDLWITWARFGQWRRIAGARDSGEFFAALSRGLADVHLGVMDDARKMLALYGNTDADFRWILAAAIDEREGDVKTAAADLQRALKDQAREDGAEQLPIIPAGEALGALYYRAHDYRQSADAFAATLARYPNDPRALYGLALAQRELGQAVRSQQTMNLFQQIWKGSAPPDPADL